MAGFDEPILSRLNRLDHVLRELEEIRGSGRSPRSWSPSTPSSGTHTSDGPPSSLDFSLKSLEKHCRPIHRVIVETEVKGTLIQRLNQVEDRVLKLCSLLEEELEAEIRREGNGEERRKKKKGLKQFLKKVVKGGSGIKRQSNKNL